MKRAVAIAVWVALAGRALAQQVTRLPTLVTFVAADYPPAALAARAGAVVVLSIVVAADGSVAAVTVAESGGADFDAAAVAAAQRFVFTPAEVDGKPTAVKTSYRYVFTPPPLPEPVPASLAGVVLLRDGREPAPGVTVTLDGARAAMTDAAGHFAFSDVPPGAHAIALSGPGLQSAAAAQDVAAGSAVTVTYLVERVPPPARPGAYQTTVRGRRLRAESTAVTVRADDARKLPGTQGDSLKVVQVLPGVARASVGSGRLVVWGAAPGDTRVELDGVEIGSLYHVGGLRSTVSSDLVASVVLVPGAFGADHGRALGGLVQIETRPLPACGVHGHLGLDVLDASGMLSASAGGVRFAAAGRYSLLDRLVAGTLGATAREVFPIPSYHDHQVMLDRPLRAGEDLTALVVGSHDLLARTVSAADPAEVRSERTVADFERVLVRYTRTRPDGSTILVTPSIGSDDSSTRLRFGATPTELATHTLRYAVRAAYREPVTGKVAVAIGLDGAGASSDVTRVGSLTSPPREGDLTVFGQPPPGDVSRDAWTARIVDVAPYASVDVTLGTVTLTPGLRFDGVAISGDRNTPRSPGQPALGYARLSFTLDPRLAVTWQVSPRLELGLAGGVYHQAPAPEDLSAVFGNPSLTPARAVHLVARAAWHPAHALDVELTGFYKRLDGLAVRSAAANPQVAHALVADGDGRSYGAQLLVKQALSAHVFGWASYAVSRSERRTPGEPAHAFDYDQTHVLAVMGTYAWRRWTFGARFRYATGQPRTPAYGSLYNAATDRYEPILGALDSIRVPAFHQLDARVERGFGSQGRELTVYLDVENLTARKNPEEIVYNADFTERGALTGLPTLAVIGARLDF